jgi:hypothetical protein
VPAELRAVGPRAVLDVLTEITSVTLNRERSQLATNQFAEMQIMVILSIIIIIIIIIIITLPSYMTFLKELTVIKLIKKIHDYDVV